MSKFLFTMMASQVWTSLHAETGNGLPQTVATKLEAQNRLECHCMLQRYDFPSLEVGSLARNMKNSPKTLFLLHQILRLVLCIRAGSVFRASSKPRFVPRTVCDLFRIQGTLNQHGYHNILQQGKAAKKCSAYVGTPSRLLEKQSRGSWVRECQECAKLASTQI